MALHEATQHATYLSIFDGSIVQTSKEPREGYERHEKDGNVKYLKRYPGFDGFISDIYWFDREIMNGAKRIKGWNIVIEDGKDRFQLSMPLNSAATNVFMNCAGNIDFTQKVDFSVWKGKDGKTAFLMRQPDRTGDTVKRCHTRDNPNGMPEAKFSEKRGWDFSGPEDFLIEKMESTIIPACKAAKAERAPGDFSGDDQTVGIPDGSWKGSVGGNDYSTPDESDIPF